MYCSIQCQTERNENYTNAICSNCGKEFRIKISKYNKLMNQEIKNVYCSAKCSYDSKKNGEIIRCDYCNEEIYRTQYRINKNGNNFCSLECESKHRSLAARKVNNCEYCGNEIVTTMFKNKRFCSSNCQNEWQKTITGELNPNYERVDVVCDFCGKTLHITKSRLKNKHHFCNTDCRQKWFSIYYSKDPVWVEKSRQRAVRILSDGLISKTNTIPQVIINNMLSTENISYCNEKDFKYYCVDNYLNDYNLIIEVMGDYWHSNPNKFKLLNNTQKNRIAKDKAKHSYIKNNYGIEILYLWEDDIINRPNLCLKLIQCYIENNGSLFNYHSFNYIFNDEEQLSPAKLIVLSYFDQYLIPSLETEMDNIVI